MPNPSATATFAIAALAFILSYSKLSELAHRAGYGDTMSGLYPLIIDGLGVVATYGVLRLEDNRYSWFLLVAATTVSVAAAVASSTLPPGPLLPVAAAFVSVVPALCLLAAPHLAVQLAHNRDATPTTEDLAPATLEVARGPDDTDPVVAPVATDESEGCDNVVPIAPEDRRTQALRLVESGESIRSAAREVGVSDTTVRRWMKAELAA
ncbi:DUF2637 domain-containing protein [Rhodococcus zopfii]|uniref:DUF2637 domain-containing protein n=1 Tax=Rhodococcus zopfii TaxID=43772 RepID=UPI0011110C67|nr:DUF2637 domain-containing protein [Rhodococcus zopfii]